MADERRAHTQIMELVGGMTVLELHELVKFLQDERGLSAALTGTPSTVMKLVGGMTVLELNELSKILQDEWGVTGAVAAAPAAEESTESQVVLKEFGTKKLDVIKAVREVLPTLGLKEAQDLVESAPVGVGNPIARAEAQKIIAKLKRAGAVVEVIPSPSRIAPNATKLQHPGTQWIRNHQSQLAKNRWVAASERGLQAEAATISDLMAQIRQMNINMADLAITFVTDDTII